MLMYRIEYPAVMSSPFKNDNIRWIAGAVGAIIGVYLLYFAFTHGDLTGIDKTVLIVGGIGLVGYDGMLIIMHPPKKDDDES